MKIVTVIGARPQFVKAAVVSRALARAGIDDVLVHTGQHYDPNMSDVFFAELGIAKPAYNLGVGSGLHGAQTARMLEGIERILVAENPDWAVVYGDTNSTLAGALAAAKLHIPVAHVEAGLRSWNRQMPEELNRILTDHSATLLFAPTAAAVSNLCAEGINGTRVRLVGDVMYDAVLLFSELTEATSDVLQRLGLSSGGYVLATIHRAENTDSPARLQAILSGLLKVAHRLPVVLPLHPRTRHVVEQNHELNESGAELFLIDPVGYLDMLMLEKHARVIATDSGGVQKEAFFHRVPCVTLRDETEWVEIVELGCNRLAPPHSADAVAAAIEAALDLCIDTTESPYGDGHSAEYIAAELAVSCECPV
ncbi:MAG: UDP-N-acetylglucosamine 2-epimerase (non-hydrolyzing) [Acidobacteriia bacterium]|nr:UDP-N-acetylglucosamine 2-epimerase (non-hydrolyzing) [Terriglobia bacterium]